MLNGYWWVLRLFSRKFLIFLTQSNVLVILLIQAGLAASIGGGDFDTTSSSSGVVGGDSSTNETVDELQDRVIQLEQELIDAHEKYEEELEMEKVRFLYFTIAIYKYAHNAILTFLRRRPNAMDVG